MSTKNNSNGTLVYQEVFSSIQGESTDSGLPCVFVRLYGCNIGCLFCDQPQAPKDRKVISQQNMLYKISKFGIPYVCITGGEPMLQWESVYPLVLELCSCGYKVSIETSGCIPIEPDPYIRSFKYVMDIKCPSSGVNYKNIYDNLMNLQSQDEVKFVISDRNDYNFAKRILKNYPTQAKILFSPCFDKNNKPLIGSELSEWLIEDKLFNARVQIQLHKILGVP